MRIDSRDLTSKNKTQLKAFYKLIPLTEKSIELHLINGLVAPLLPEHLAYIPKHITSVKLIGTYIYGVKDVSDSDDPIGRFICISQIPPEVRKSLRYLPGSVSSLSIDFSYNPRNNAPQNLDTLINIAAHLPKHISTFNIAGTDLHKSDEQELIRLFSSIPESVHSLSFRLFKLNLIKKLLSTLHSQLNELILDNCQMGSQALDNPQQLLSLFSAIKPNVKKLSLVGNNLAVLGKDRVNQLLQTLPQELEVLDLSDNQLAQLASIRTSSLCSNLPANLKVLLFAANSNTSASINYAELFQTLNDAPESLQEFNFSFNSITRLTKASSAFSKIPSQMRCFAFFDPMMLSMERKKLSVLFNALPKHLHTLSFRGCIPLFNQPIEKILQLLSLAPSHISTFDLSNTALNQWPADKLAALIRGLPSSIKKLILKQNHLACLLPDVLVRGFANAQASLTEVDLSENGFNQLPVNEMYQRFDSVSEQIRFIWDNNQFYTKNRGALITLPALKNTSDSKNEYAVKPQTHSLSLMESSNQLTLPCWALVQRRIEDLVVDANQLDLSRCDLNRIAFSQSFINLLSTMPTHIISINMSNNNFSSSKESLELLAALFNSAPKHIVHFDLSGHGFEILEGEKLTPLFSKLNGNIQYISLSPGKPISPAQQLAKRAGSDFYLQLTKNNSSIVHKGRSLLADYTKNNSPFLRFLHGHWNRTQIKEAEKIIALIDEEIITEEHELFDELEQLRMPNEAGALNKRLCFLQRIASENRKNSLKTEELSQKTAFEMKRIENR